MVWKHHTFVAKEVHLWPGKTTFFQFIGCIYGLEKSHFCRQRGAFINGREKSHLCLQSGAVMAGENHTFIAKEVHSWQGKTTPLSGKRCIYGWEKSHFWP